VRKIRLIRVCHFKSQGREIYLLQLFYDLTYVKNGQKEGKRPKLKILGSATSDSKIEWSSMILLVFSIYKECGKNRELTVK
jgi:hypothetical protein